MARTYEFISNGNNSTLAKIEKSINRANLRNSMGHNISNNFQKQVSQQLKKSVSDAQDGETKSVTKHSVQGVGDVTKALKVTAGVGITELAFNHSAFKTSIAYTEMVGSGSYSHIVGVAEKLGVRLENTTDYLNPIEMTLSRMKNDEVITSDIRLQTFNNMATAKEQIKAYDVFLRVANSNVNMTQELRKDAKSVAKDVKKLKRHLERMVKLEDAANSMRHGRVKSVLNPLKHLTRSVIGKSEVYRGYSMTAPVVVPVVTGATMMSASASNVVTNIAINKMYSKTAEKLMAKAFQKGNPISRKAAMDKAKMIVDKAFKSRYGVKPTKTKFYKLTKKNPVLAAIKRTMLRNMRIARARALRSFANVLTNTNSIFLQNVGIRKAAKAQIKIAKAQYKAGEITKEAFKNTVKSAKSVARRTTRIGRFVDNRLRILLRARQSMQLALRAVFRRFAQTAIGRPIVAVGRFVLAPLRALLQFAGTMLKGLASVIGAVTGFFSAIFSFIMSVFIVLLLAVYILDLTQNALRGVFMFASMDSQSWESYSQKSYKALQEKHASYEDTLESYLSQYSTYDVQFPSGSQENYKEIFSAVMIMLQYNPKVVEYDDIKEMVSDMYEKTHKITVEEYDFNYNNGSSGKAAHIYVNILREDTILYEAFSGGDVITSVNGAGGSVAYASAPVTAPTDDWISCIQAVKQAIASTGTAYSQTTTVPITINGKTINVRPDCSGFVSACLAIYGGAPNNNVSDDGKVVPTYSTADLQGQYIEGFQVFKFSSWDNLGVGDILVTNGKGHTEIYAGRINGRDYVYNCGATDAVQTAGPTYPSYSTYYWVYRPNSAGVGGQSTVTGSGGTSSSATGSTTGSATNPDGSYVVDSSASSNTAEDYVGNAAVGSPLWNPEAHQLSMSNMKNVVFDEETGNEKGYKLTLKGDLETAYAGNNPAFPINHYDESGVVHLKLSDQSEKSHTISSNDFVRYMLAKHGVSFNFDPIINMNELPWVPIHTDSDKTYTAGDIMYYVPRRTGVEGDYNVDYLTEALMNYADGNVNYVMDSTDFSEDIIYQSHVDGHQAKNTPEVLCRIKAIPMIYDGNGYWYYYGGDVNIRDDQGDYEGLVDAYNDSEKGVKRCKLSDLEENRIVTILRPTGYTCSAVYGYNDFFNGWTDFHVNEFIQLANDSCWSTKSFTYEVTIGDETENHTGDVSLITDDDWNADGKELKYDSNGNPEGSEDYVEEEPDDEVEQVGVDSTGTQNVDYDSASDEGSGYDSDDFKFTNGSIDYTWYKEEYFHGGQAYLSPVHGFEVSEELLNLFIRNYEDWGVLPSVGFSYSYAITNMRTTEESLKYNNMFGILADAGGVDVRKYEYNDDGNVATSSVSYAKFDNYLGSAMTWLNQCGYKGANSSVFNPDAYTKDDFEKQFYDMQLAGCFRDGTVSYTVLGEHANYPYGDYALLIHNNFKDLLDAADKIAVERYARLKEAREAVKDWNSYWATSVYNGTDEPADYRGTVEEYNLLKSKAERVYNAAANMKKYDAEGPLQLASAFGNPTSTVRTHTFYKRTEVDAYIDLERALLEIGSKLKTAKVVAYDTVYYPHYEHEDYESEDPTTWNLDSKTGVWTPKKLTSIGGIFGGIFGKKTKYKVNLPYFLNNGEPMAVVDIAGNIVMKQVVDEDKSTEARQENPHYATPDSSIRSTTDYAQASKLLTSYRELIESAANGNYSDIPDKVKEAIEEIQENFES